jgi:hypothetical protein
LSVVIDIRMKLSLLRKTKFHELSLSKKTRCDTIAARSKNGVDIISFKQRTELLL